MTTQPDQSYIGVRNGTDAVSFVGKDAVALFRAKAIAGALKLYAKTGMKANRAYTPSAMLAAAKEITGKDYRGKTKYMDAYEGIMEWARAMETALPIVDESAPRE